jgi:hypothetical protein
MVNRTSLGRSRNQKCAWEPSIEAVVDLDCDLGALRLCRTMEPLQGNGAGALRC